MRINEERATDEERHEALLMRLFAPASEHERRGAIWNATLPGAPEPQDVWMPTPFVPVRPLAIGMIANTMLYSTLVALVVLAPGAWRVWRRERRGSCVGCGYDLAGLGEGACCPECGAIKKPPACARGFVER